jgi:hypothetical protein
MSDYTTHTWSNGDDFDAAATNGWDGRIDDLATAHEATQTAIQGDVTAAEGDISALQLLAITAPVSPTGVLGSGSFPYTLHLVDAGCVLPVTAASGTITVPTNASVDFETGTVIEIEHGGSGTLTFAAAGGVTIRSRGGVLTVTTQYSVVRLRQTTTLNTWWLSGELG